MTYFAVYWIVCLGFWWVLIGRTLSKRYAQLTGSTDATDRHERHMIVLLTVIDIISAPLFVPVDLIRRGINGLHAHYVSIK